MSRLLSFSNRRLDQEQAATWIARIDRGLRGSEKDDLRKWLADDARRRAELLEAASLWDRMDVLSELADLFPLHDEASRRYGGAVQVALAAIALAGLVTVMWAIRPHVGEQRAEPHAAASIGAQPTNGGNALEIAPLAASYATAIGEQRTVDLPDHSIVRLNTNTALEVEYSASARLIRLIRGEANFQVAKNPGRVFTVRASGFDFNAVGTAFNVRADLPQGIRLTVTEGRVRVLRTLRPTPGGVQSLPEAESSRIAEVGANREVVIGTSIEPLKTLDPAEIMAATAWQRGMMIFAATPLRQVIAEVERYSTTRFAFADEELGNVPVSGYFELGDVDALSAALQRNFGIVLRKGDNLIVVSASPPK